MVAIKASSRLQDNVDIPWVPCLYGVSTLHCMTVSLSQQGAGLGAVWRELRRPQRNLHSCVAGGGEDPVERGGEFGVPIPDKKPKPMRVLLEVHQQIPG